MMGRAKRTVVASRSLVVTPVVEVGVVAPELLISVGVLLLIGGGGPPI
jgi:hypothetical protein